MSVSNPSVSTLVGAATPEDSAAMTAAELELCEIIVKTLNLEMAASEVDPLGAIYGEGLGLDSIDILEISLVISKHYGFQLKSDDQNNKTIYQTVRSLCAHVQANRTK
jgi:acyl carrier protein